MFDQNDYINNLYFNNDSWIPNLQIIDDINKLFDNRWWLILTLVNLNSNCVYVFFLSFIWIPSNR